MKTWKIIEVPEFKDWFKKQEQFAKIDIAAKVQLLAFTGPSLGRPHADTLKDSHFPNMKELRIQSNGKPFRVFFAFDPKRQAVLLIGGNKEGQKRFYKELIPVADRLFTQYLEEL